MPKVQVNQITSQTGGVLTVGQSGDTVTLAAGATSSGFGATYNGALNWSSTIYATDFTAVSGVGYFVNTASAAVTVTLPASPAFGDVVAIKDWSSTSATNFITIARNGNLIESNASNAYIKNHGLSTTLVYSGATKGWMVVDSGDVNDIQLPEFVSATGGTILTCGNYKTHVFTGSGCFVVSSGGNDLGSNSVEYLVVAGGGSGGSSGFSVNGSAGAGAGGFRQNYPSPTTAGLPVTVTTYPITIGSGAASNPSAGRGNTGSNSVFSTITSAGGGAGAGTYTAATSGGSGGGAMTGGPGGPSIQVAGSGNTPPVSPPQGNPGGTSTGGGFNASGGGAGAAGIMSSAGPAAAGGVGLSWTNPLFGPTASSYGTTGPVPGVRYFAGGGGAGAQGYSGATPTGGIGGSGGGGAGGNYTGPSGNPGTDGTTNTGGGGGGGSNNDQPGTISRGGAGGSGIVVIRYKYQ
jgi:hypothetical protein